MSPAPTASKLLKPLLEVRTAFYEARQKHYLVRRKPTPMVIREIRLSRKTAQSENSLKERA